MAGVLARVRSAANVSTRTTIVLQTFFSPVQGWLLDRFSVKWVYAAAIFGGYVADKLIGYQRAISERATVTVGGAFSGDEKSAGVGFGIDL